MRCNASTRIIPNAHASFDETCRRVRRFLRTSVAELYGWFTFIVSLGIRGRFEVGDPSFPIREQTSHVEGIIDKLLV